MLIFHSTNASFSKRHRIVVALLSILSVWMLVSPAAQATPIAVNVYGAPYFSLPGVNGKNELQQWMVLAPQQTLMVGSSSDRIDLDGPQQVSLLDQSGQHNQFSFLDLSLNLPGQSAESGGFVEYLMGDIAGRFEIQQVVHRRPFLNAGFALSVMFWGIDYDNSVGLILGLEAVASVSTPGEVAAVNEPSTALLLLLGFFGVFLARRSGSTLCSQRA